VYSHAYDSLRMIVFSTGIFDRTKIPHSTNDWYCIRCCPFHYYLLCSVAQKCLDPSLYGISDTVVIKFLQESFMWYSIEHFWKIEDDKVVLIYPTSKDDNSSCASVKSWVSQLRLALNPCWQSVKIWWASRCLRILLTIICSCTLQQRLVSDTGR
jgi:hypothetical protein